MESGLTYILCSIGSGSEDPDLAPMCITINMTFFHFFSHVLYASNTGKLNLFSHIIRNQVTNTPVSLSDSAPAGSDHFEPPINVCSYVKTKGKHIPPKLWSPMMLLISYVKTLR